MDGYITIGTQLNTKEFDKQILDLERKVNDLEKIVNSPKDIGLSPREIHEVEVELEKTRNKLIGLYNQKMKIQKSGKMNKVFEGIATPLQNAIKSASKLVLGIFAIRSAYMALRRASSDLTSYDQQYAANLEYIRFALTQAIAPVLRYIVNLAATLLGYINAIAQAWFGVNLFANGSVEAFNKMKKGAAGVGKAVKEIKKQLLGFDEINVLTEQSDTGTSAGAGGIAPNFDLSGMQGEVPEWLDWIIKNKGLIITAVEGMASAFIALKYGLDVLQGAGIFLIIKGIEKLIENIQTFSESPSVQKFGNILQSIGVIITGLALVINSLPIAILGGALAIIGGIVSFFGAIIEFIENPNWENFTEILRGIIKTLGVVGWLIDWLVEDILGGWDNVTQVLQTVGEWIYNNIIQPVMDFFQPMIEFIVGIVTGLWNTLSSILETIWNTIKSVLETIWSNIKILIDNAVKIFNFVKEKIHEFFSPIAEFFGNIFTTAFNKIKQVFSPIIQFFQGIWNKLVGIFQTIGSKVGEIISGAFKGVVNGVLRAVETILNAPIRAINGLIGIINAVPGINLGRLNTFNLPRLAVGGIVNMPNTGTMIGGAIAGESGREGVLPLTDAQTMAELGREIGRWITINANITNTMNGRVISRELKHIQNEQDFAYNT